MVSLSNLNKVMAAIYLPAYEEMLAILKKSGPSRITLFCFDKEVAKKKKKKKKKKNASVRD